MHPNIVAIYDFAVHEGNPFLAMEYVEARNLGQVLAESGRFAPAEAVAIIGQVLDALACAHAVGIVHRDVKPANILLLANGRVKMTDFGIARFDGAELTLDGAVIGTPSYMSPEQCRGEQVDARSDLFSTGVVLYELLSGERPFPGRNFAEVTWRLANEPPADIRAEGCRPVAAAGRGSGTSAGQGSGGPVRLGRGDGRRAAWYAAGAAAGRPERWCCPGRRKCRWPSPRRL